MNRLIMWMDTERVYSYLNKLESAYILHRCSRYDIKGKEILKKIENVLSVPSPAGETGGGIFF